MAELVANPDVIFVLLAFAGLAFVVEAANPGMTVPGGTGVALLLAAGVGLSREPATPWGLATMAVGAALLGLEQVPRFRAAAPVAGLLLLMLGGFLLFPPGDGPQSDGVDRWLLLVVSGIVTAGAIVAARTARRVRYARRPVHHPGDHEGRTVRLDRADGRRGQAKLDGTWWTVEANDELIAGQEVRVVGRRDLTLIVEPAGTSDAEETPCQT